MRRTRWDERVASDADLDGTGLRIGVVLRPLQRPHHRPPARGRPTGPGRPRRRRGRRRPWCGSPAPSSCPSSPSTCSPARARSTRSSPRRRHPGRDRRTTTSWRGSAPPGIQQVQLDTGVPVVFGVLTTENARAGPRPLQRRGQQGRRGCRDRHRDGQPLEVAVGRALTSRSLDPVLRLVLPKGSLERATLELFEAPTCRRPRSSAVDYQATIDDPRIDEVRILRPQEIPTLRGRGPVRPRHHRPGLDRGDRQRRRDPRRAPLLARPRPARSDRRGRAAATPPSQAVADLPQGVRVSTEYPELTRRFFEKQGIEADIRLSYGATEAKVPDIVDCIVDDHRDGPGPARRRPARSSTRSCTSLHRADRQPGGLRRPRQAPRHGADPDPARGHARGPGQGAGEAERGRRPTSTR